MITIVVPQALRIIVPPLTNEFVLLIKDTSLISVLGVTDKTIDLAQFGNDGVAQEANATPLIVAGLVYLAMTLPLTQLVAYMERRAKAAGK
jgi:polar amino acid transport system permease protein